MIEIQARASYTDAMTKPTKQQLKAAAKILAQGGASLGGKARWKGKTAEEMKAHALMMVEARRKKKVKKSVDN